MFFFFFNHTNIDFCSLFRVTDEETVVLADFGLSRSVLSGIYTMQDNNAAVPWRTLPPEVLSSPQKEFSTTTDVVSVVHYLNW